jgi:hypothetical protein
MTTINYSKHIWEGWTVRDFVFELEDIVSFQTFKDKEELKKWCMDNQPYYKKHIPEVVNHFAQKLKL